MYNQKSKKLLEKCDEHECVEEAMKELESTQIARYFADRDSLDNELMQNIAVFLEKLNQITSVSWNFKPDTILGKGVIEAIEALPEVNTIAIKLLYGLNEGDRRRLTLKEVAKIMGISVESVRQYHYKGIITLAAHELGKIPKFDLRVIAFRKKQSEEFEKERADKRKEFETRYTGNEHIEVLNLSIRTTNCLLARGVKTVDDFVKLEREEAAMIRNLSRKHFDEIVEKRDEIGMPMEENSDSEYFEITSVKKIKEYLKNWEGTI